jgi:hypothetical protein
MPISTRQPVIGAPFNKSMSLTVIDGKKISVVVAFGRGAERSSARALVALSNVFAGGVVERRLLSGQVFDWWCITSGAMRRSCTAVYTRSYLSGKRVHVRRMESSISHSKKALARPQ